MIKFVKKIESQQTKFLVQIRKKKINNKHNCTIKNPY